MFQAQNIYVKAGRSVVGRSPVGQ